MHCEKNKVIVESSHKLIHFTVTFFEELDLPHP